MQGDKLKKEGGCNNISFLSNFDNDKFIYNCEYINIKHLNIAKTLN